MSHAVATLIWGHSKSMYSLMGEGGGTSKSDKNIQRERVGHKRGYVCL